MSANEPDDLSELLSPKPGAPDAALREALFRRTARALRVRIWARRGAKCAVAAALLLGAFALGRASAPDAPTPEARTEFVAVPVAVPVLPSEPDPPPAARTARALELDAEQADGMAAARLYRDAGDAFLTAESDFANAARCYRLFLARAGAAGRALETGDSWLLVSLKNQSFKEQTDEQALRN